MQTILTTILIALTLLMSSVSSVPFCDIKALDNVFNIGHLVYMTRCGELWTYDQMMDGGQGGFLRDYSVYAFARKHFGTNMMVEGNPYLRFAAFSFQEVNCLKSDENLEKKCGRSVEKWNGVTIIADNITAVTFKYDTEIKTFQNESENPFNFKTTQDMRESATRDRFWPVLSKLTSQRVTATKKASIHSGLFVTQENRLYIALRDNDLKKYFCITYLDMDRMLHDINFWPKNSSADSIKWHEARCFTGNLVGLFYYKGKAYMAGRTWDSNSDVEDLVYKMNANANGEASITLERAMDYNGGNGGNGRNGRNGKNGKNGKNGRMQANLRTFFGCRHTEKVVTKKKRSIPETEQDFSRQSIINEFKRNWIQLIPLLAINLILVYVIIRFSLTLRFRPKNVNKKE